MASNEHHRKIIDHLIFPKGNTCRPDIYAFQETHTKPGLESDLSQVLGPNTLYSHGESNSRGILLGFHPNLPVQITSTVSDRDGHYIVANVVIDDAPLTIIALYIPPCTLRGR